MSATKKSIYTENAPVPIGPYSQAVMANNIMFVSGQIAIEPESGNLVLDDIETETQQVMKNIAAILLEAHLGFDQVVKASIFLKNMDDFAAVNRVYESYFKKEAHYPARETVQVAKLPKDVNVEISVIAAA
jgi:2-iminobutanoate/2-iminopropanoate deaminase